MLFFQCEKVGCNFQSGALPKASFWQLDFFFHGVCVFDVFCFFLIVLAVDKETLL